MTLLSLTATNAVEINVTLNHGKKVTPVKYGFHYEEIGMIGDGGLNAEMIRNRGLEEAMRPKGLAIMDGQYLNVPDPKPVRNKYVPEIDPLIGWISLPASSNNLRLTRTLENPLNEENPHSLFVRILKNDNNTEKGTVYNEGYYGMSFVSGSTYKLSFYWYNKNLDGKLTFALADAHGSPVSKKKEFVSQHTGWTKYELELTADKNEPRGMLYISPEGKGSFQLDMVSMMPNDTWDNGKSIFRKDIMKNLVEYSPDFIRFPGGCIVHGVNIETMYHWKETIGDPAKRPGEWSKWEPYYRTDGIGYHEFYELCEYLKADAMYVCSTGMVCTGWVTQSPNDPMNYIQPDVDINYYINDALAAIEYALGDSTTYWGKMRSKNGHPGIFPLKYIEIGNEDFGPIYYQRFEIMSKAIHDRYPKLKIIANSIIGRENPDKRKYLSQFPSTKYMDIFDEHYYENLDWAIDNFKKFDGYDRKGPQLFIGELGIGGKYPANTLGEGILKMDMESNGDLSPIMADRPMMRNWDFVDKSAGSTILLHNTNSSVKTFNYLMCKLFRDNKINVYYPSTVNNRSIDPGKKIFTSVGKDENTGEYVVKIINLDAQAQPVFLTGFSPKRRIVKKIVLTTTPDKRNTPDTPNEIVPIIETKESAFPLQQLLMPYSMTVYRFK